MKLISRRPTVLLWVTSLAVLAAQVHQHTPCGFHQW